MTRYISAAEVYAINEQILGMRPFVLNRHLLRSAVERPMTRMFGHEAYPTLMEKAAALLHSLAHDHLFADGNKRTATEATVQFLEANGCQINWTDAEAYQFILEIAQGQRGIEDIAQWLLQHTSADAAADPKTD